MFRTTDLDDICSVNGPMYTYKVNNRLRPDQIDRGVEGTGDGETDGQLEIFFLRRGSNAVEAVHHDARAPHHGQLVEQLHLVPQCHVKEPRANADDQ